MNKRKDLTTNEAWEAILQKYDIVRHIKEDGVYCIETSQIKEFREPRLMSKWDSSEQLPAALKKNNINILPDSRHSYILSDFLLYEKLPELEDNVTQVSCLDLPEYESVDIDNITSEANAINVMMLTNMLNDFLENDGNVQTFNGRMGTGEFEFDVDSNSGVKRHVEVSNAQCEIDGGFENNESVVIMEAKNVIHPDFNVRQLYYPYRLWSSKVKKPIRLVFSIYSNKIYRLFEYEFTDINDYSSIRLVRNKNYSLQNTKITIDDLVAVRNKTKVIYSDNQNKSKIPFIQANSFERVISLLENIYDNPMTDAEIADLMHFGSNESNGHVAYRQSQYYFNAGKYLGLFEKDKNDKNEVVTVLTKLGNNVFVMNYRQRQLELVSLMLQHQIFAELFDYMLENNLKVLNAEIIVEKMKQLNVCGDSQINRRSSSVKNWLKWIFNLTNL